MNTEHLALCSSERWATHIGGTVVPWALAPVDLAGATVLELGPGPGAATDVLRRAAGAVVAVEYDAGLATALAERFAGDPAVEVVHGDATDLPFRPATFDAVVSFTMLHHIPSEQAQDMLFGEAARVLRPGGVFVGTDSLGGPDFVAFHHDDVCVPLDPVTLAERLEDAGFADAQVDVGGDGVRWVASTPEADGSRARVNERFAELYLSDEIRAIVDTSWVPQLLDVAGLGDDPLHLTAGPAVATPALRAAAPRFTVAQIDHAFTPAVRTRHADDPGVEVVDVDPTDLPFPDGRFSAATIVHSLAHLRSTRAQDRALAEIARVLRPGAPFVGLNVLDGGHFRSMNAHDRGIPVEPHGFPARLEAAGFVDVRYDLWQFPRFSARTPARRADHSPARR